jgi:hypothetical protein
MFQINPVDGHELHILRHVQFFHNVIFKICCVSFKVHVEKELY